MAFNSFKREDKNTGDSPLSRMDEKCFSPDNRKVLIISKKYVSNSRIWFIKQYITFITYCGI
jgi:hypothetical protein